MSAKGTKRAAASDPVAGPALKKKSKSTEAELLRDQVAQLESQLLAEPRKNANRIAELLKIMRETKLTPVIVAAFKSLFRVFEKLLRSGDFSLVRTATRSDVQKKVIDDTDKAQQIFQEWLSKRHAAYSEQLVDLLSYDDEGLQLDVLLTAMELVKAEMASLQSSFEHAHDHILRYGPFSALLWKLVSDESINKATIAQFRDAFLLGNDDVRFYVYESLARQLNNDSVSVDDHCIDTIFDLVGDINMPSSVDQLNDFYFAPEDRMKDLKRHRKAFTDFWVSYLRRPLTSFTYKRVLLTIHELVIPHLTNPVLLVDFLRFSYSRGGVVALLALHGVFVLMTKHNLEYPEFFTQLYALFEPSVFFVKYRARFFKLCDLFLSSPMLPAYLIAAFAKRIARLCLHAPPAGILIAIPFVYNLLKRNPSCMQIIHRSPETDRATAVRAHGQDVVQNGKSDPFVMEESDPAKCNALASSLWEFDALKSHYSPSVSKLVRLFEQPFRKDPLLIESFLQNSYQSLFDLELNRNYRAVPTAFEEFEHVLPVAEPEFSAWKLDADDNS